MKRYFDAYSQEEINNAYEKLSRFTLQTDNINRYENWGIISNHYDNEIWEQKSFKRSHLTKVEIRNSVFSSCAFVGSVFQQVAFSETAFKGCNLTFCVFSNCEFSFNEKITAYEGSNFGSSEFINCKFRNVAFKTSTLSQSRFVNCSFEKCEFSSDTLENTVFDCCQFNRVNMRSLNLEFSSFKNCDIKNVSFPLFQFPYVFGAKEILDNFAEKKDNDGLIFCANGQEVSLPEYLELLPSLAVYYKEKNQLFPYANILLMCNDEGQATEKLIEGIQSSLNDNDFRYIEHYCRLGRHYSVIDAHLSQYILHAIDDKIISLNSENGNGEVNSAAVNANNIRNILLYDTANKCKLQFELETKIPIGDTKKVNALQNRIQEVIDEYSTDKSQQFIEVTHGSPVTFVVQFLVAHPEIVIEVSYALLRVATTFGKKLIRKYKMRRDKDFIAKEIKSKYGDDVNIHGREWTDLLKTEIRNIMLETSDKLVEKKRSTVNKHINAITQRIFDVVDNRLQTDKSCIILTTRRPDSLSSEGQSVVPASYARGAKRVRRRQ